MRKSAIFSMLVLSVMMIVSGALAAAAYPQDAASLPVPQRTPPVISGINVSGGALFLTFSGAAVGGEAVCYVTWPGVTEQHCTVPMVAQPGGLTSDLSKFPAGAQIQQVLYFHVNTQASGYTFSYYYDSLGTLGGGNFEAIADPAANGGFDESGTIHEYHDAAGAAHYMGGRLAYYVVTTADGWEKYDGEGVRLQDCAVDPLTGDVTMRTYAGGRLRARTFYDVPEGIVSVYDARGTLRSLESDTIQESYGADGALLTRAVTGADGTECVYDAAGTLLSKSGLLPGGIGSYSETYREGQPVRREEYNLSDSDNEQLYYENGVLVERWANDIDSGYTIFDGLGNRIGTYLYAHDGNYYYRRYDADGCLTEYATINQQMNQTGVYSSSGSLKRVMAWDMDFHILYEYEADTGRWYINGAPHSGPAPIDLYASGLKTSWYPDNTLCSFGPQFRDIDPALTDKWYMFTPIDVSRDGAQTFELIASNMYVIGQVKVTVNGDDLTVEYSTVFGKLGHVYIKSEFLTFFPDLAGVTTVNPEELGGGYAFGKPISIANDLKGDTNVLMFIRNVATFRNSVRNGVSLQRYYKTDKNHTALRDAMTALMD